MDQAHSSNQCLYRIRYTYTYTYIFIFTYICFHKNDYLHACYLQKCYVHLLRASLFIYLFLINSFFEINNPHNVNMKYVYLANFMRISCFDVPKTI